MATLQGSSLGLKLLPSPSPSLASSTVASRFKNEAFAVLASRSRVVFKYNMHRRRPTSSCRSSQGSYQELHSFSPRGILVVQLHHCLSVYVVIKERSQSFHVRMMKVDIRTRFIPKIVIVSI